MKILFRNPNFKSILTLVGILLFMLSGKAYSQITYAQTLTVTKVTDPDPFLYNFDDVVCDPSMLGTLQWAIRKANDYNSPTKIVFNISGTGSHVIKLNYQIPDLAETVFIDGNSNPDYITGSSPVIIIDGSNLGKSAVGLVARSGANNCTIQGLHFINFQVCLWMETQYDLIQNNIFELAAYIKGSTNGFISVVADANCDILNNEFLGNRFGIVVTGNNNTIQGNYIGINSSLTLNQGCSEGIIVAGGNNTDHNITNNNITGNTIANNELGICISDASKILISQNHIYNNTYKAIELNYNTINIVGTSYYTADGSHPIMGHSGNNEHPMPVMPVINNFSGGLLFGTATSGDKVEIFGSTGIQNANQYLTTVIADVSGNWSYYVGTTKWYYFTATATDANNNTSELSIAYAVPATYTCNRETLYVSTGYNHNTNTVYTVGDADPNWTVTQVPDNTTVPRSAFCVAPYINAWLPAISGSQWISAYNVSDDNINGTYIFEYTFCLEATATNPSLHLEFRVDDASDVYLNGNYIGEAKEEDRNQNVFKWVTPAIIDVSDASKFIIGGKNIIQIQVKNRWSVAMGLNVYGYVTISGTVGLLDAPCCNPNSKIQGRVWNDLNGDGIINDDVNLNGKIDYDESALSGWLVVCSNGMMEMTDSKGYYYFNDVVPGIYIINALIPPSQLGNWKQTFPVSRAYIINIGKNQVISNKDFGFQPTSAIVEPCQVPCIGSFAPEPGEKYILGAWVSEENTLGIKQYDNPRITLSFASSTTTFSFKAKGPIIDGWQRIEEEFTVPFEATEIFVELENTNAVTENVYFDDIRIHPLNANMKSFVYDPVSLKLEAELDENDYATFYEYNNEGALIRVKKETEKGIKTIKESNNNTKKIK